MDERDDEQREKDGATEKSEGAKTEDNPETGEGTGEGERGLGTQTGAVEGGNSDPMRGGNTSGGGVAAHGGPPNDETRDN